MIQPNIFSLQYLNQTIQKRKLEILNQNIFEKYLNCFLREEWTYNLNYNDTYYKLNLQNLEDLKNYILKNYNKETDSIILPEIYYDGKKIKSIITISKLILNSIIF